MRIHIEQLQLVTNAGASSVFKIMFPQWQLALNIKFSIGINRINRVRDVDFLARTDMGNQ